MAYTKYAAYLGWTELDGSRMRRWEDLSSPKQEAWRIVVQHVRREQSYESPYPSRPLAPALRLPRRTSDVRDHASEDIWADQLRLSSAQIDLVRQYCGVCTHEIEPVYRCTCAETGRR